MTKRATLYRMVLPDHVCPFGERAKAMLEEAGYDVDDRLLTSREEVDAFKDEHALATTPLIVIDDQPIPGSEALAVFLHDQSAEPAPTRHGAFSW
jgi:glutaredoxin 3